MKYSVVLLSLLFMGCLAPPNPVARCSCQAIQKEDHVVIIPQGGLNEVGVYNQNPDSGGVKTKFQGCHSDVETK